MNKITWADIVFCVVVSMAIASVICVWLFIEAIFEKAAG
nr:MAG TPA: hypothetical protein [Caudoviricetes sp.]DAT12759.1 MAG TPA: hypothetical protein [Caudoviricetes sp.]DAX40637.1 MAG TPA: hypothetical protein [Caudoviricetes sp.]DAY41043.1 MAG TPA: hypothetical protein [Caudoviricetes sp.]